MHGPQDIAYRLFTSLKALEDAEVLLSIPDVECVTTRNVGTFLNVICPWNLETKIG